MATFETLQALAELLPEEKKLNALSLIADMQAVTLGIDDSVKHWRAPTFRIIQAMTDVDSIEGDNKAPGRIVIGSTAVPENMVELHVLRAWDSRQMWDPDVNVTKTICQSPDAKTGRRFGDCKSCEYSKWIDNAPAPCKEGKSFLTITSDFRNIVEVLFKSTHLAIGKEWQGHVKKSTKPPYQRVYQLTSAKSEKKKNLFNPVITRTDVYSEGAEEKFLEELFMFVRAQRTEQVEAFYAGIEAYRARAEKEADDVDEAQSVVIRGGDIPADTPDADLPNYSL